ncbi:MAG: hypothetical protein E6423_02265 [Clostridium sp.]|nr:hypothetical protein [Clostridium sp.]
MRYVNVNSFNNIDIIGKAIKEQFKEEEVTIGELTNFFKCKVADLEFFTRMLDNLTKELEKNNIDKRKVQIYFDALEKMSSGCKVEETIEETEEGILFNKYVEKIAEIIDKKLVKEDIPTIEELIKGMEKDLLEKEDLLIIKEHKNVGIDFVNLRSISKHSIRNTINKLRKIIIELQKEPIDYNAIEGELSGIKFFIV